MTARRPWMLLPVLLTALMLGCQDGAEPDVSLTLTGPPDLTAVVFQTTYENGSSPEGPLSQYAVWIGAPGGASADAGVVVGRDTPVFIRAGDRLMHATGGTIAVGDTIEVWRDESVAYGAVEAPPGAPCYRGTQIVILR